MYTSEVQAAAEQARLFVRARHQAATSTYIGARSAEVYDAGTMAVLGTADAGADEECGMAIERAWIDAAARLASD